MISGKINFDKVDLKKLFAGRNGRMLDVVMFETPNNQYGDDYVIVQSVTKAEREQGVKGIILGNARILRRDDAPQPRHSPPATERPQSDRSPQPQSPPKPDDSGDIPF